VTSRIRLAVFIVIGVAVIVLGSPWRTSWYRITPGPVARACESNLGALALALKKYQDDHGGACPVALPALVPQYLQQIPTCPSAQRDTYSPGYATDAGAYTVLCRGHNHGEAGLPADRPAYASRTGFLRGP